MHADIGIRQYDFVSGCEEEKVTCRGATPIYGNIYTLSPDLLGDLKCRIFIASRTVYVDIRFFLYYLKIINVLMGNWAV